MSKIILFANTDWYLYNFRRALALAAQAAGHEMVLVSPPGEYGARLRASGLRWTPLPGMDRRSLDPWREARVLAGLVALFKRERPALVHNFTIKCAVYGSLAAMAAGIPARVNAVAGLGYVFASNDPRARMLRPLVRGLMRFALRGKRSRLILQNHDDAAMFTGHGLIDPARLRVIPGSGVDCARFVPRNGTPNDPPCVLLAARLLWEKGLAEYVQASRNLRARGRKVRFLLAGASDPGNPAAVPEAAVRGWVEEGLIEWIGHVEDMPSLFASVDIVVLPSYYREGLPRSLIEAGACATPLISTDMPGCRDAVADGVNGLVVPPRDAEALGAAIVRLLDAPTLARQFGLAARARALAEFDERIVIRRTLETWDEVLDPPLGVPATD
ncbi:MAG: glycosyltransferase family 4 protein [Xanthomonadales bacterium]|nr:glycosyltransferase family 4 protein [Xanthomonadales bacterium]ODU95043.1 MAG: glycosyl transferase family 1 [Rhodanobacter sp. SCN 66-43]OJY82214.1 MAG: glycosyltransferase family 1 protein [Xanthomonadales bacterium 66-474]